MGSSFILQVSRGKIGSLVPVYCGWNLCFLLGGGDSQRGHCIAPCLLTLDGLILVKMKPAAGFKMHASHASYTTVRRLFPGADLFPPPKKNNEGGGGGGEIHRAHLKHRLPLEPEISSLHQAAEICSPVDSHKINRHCCGPHSINAATAD